MALFSIVFVGNLRTYIQITYAQNFYAFCILIGAHMLAKMSEFILARFFPTKFDICAPLLSFLARASLLPPRVRSTNGSEAQSFIVYCLAMATAHVLTLLITRSLPDEPREAAQSDNDEEGDRKDLPEDSVEVSAEEAIAIQNGSLRFRKGGTRSSGAGR